MQPSSVRLLRRALVALIVVLVAAVAWNYVETWRRRARLVSQAARILSPEMIRSAEGIEYSENERGVARFKIHARRLVETRAGVSHLEGIEAFDFNPDGATRNQIRSLRADYDRDHKKASFAGDVRIAMTGEVEVRTDTLVYDLESGIGTSDDLVSMTSPEARGSARGVRYDHTSDTLEFRSEIAFLLDRTVRKPDGSSAREKVRATAQRGFYSRGAPILRFTGAALLESESSSLAGDEVEADFSADGRHVTALRCRGHALYRSTGADGSQSLEGDEIRFAVTPATGAPERIEVSGRAAFAGSSGGATERLRAARIRLDLDPDKGQPSRIESQSGVEFSRVRGADETLVTGESLVAGFAAGTSRLEALTVRERARMVSRSGAAAKDAGPDELEAEEIRLRFRSLEDRSVPAELEAERSVRWKTPPRKAQSGAPPAEGSELRADRLKMVYAAGGDFLDSGSATGRVRLAGIALGGAEGSEIRRLEAERARFAFYPGDNRLRDFAAEGQVAVQYRRPPDPEAGRPAQEFHTSSDFIEARLRESDGAVDSVIQRGRFQYQEEGRTARAGRSEYRAETGVMALEQSPEVSDSSGTTTGERMEYDRKKEIMTVSRRVRSVLRPQAAQGGTLFAPASGAASAAPSVVTSDALRHWTAEGRARYSGGVRLMSESGTLDARELEIFDSGERVEASGDLRHLILRAEAAEQGGPARAQGEGAKKASPVTIRAPRMRYFKSENSAHYSGGAVMTSEDATLRSESLDLVLDADGKRVGRAAARGHVEVRQGARDARGEMADYYLIPGRFVVTGNPAEILDPERGKSAARRLTFFTSDDKILLENN